MKTPGAYSYSQLTWDNRLHRGIMNALLIELGIVAILKLLYEFIKAIIYK